MGNVTKVVRLLIEHPHNGRKWAAGTRLAVSAKLADWWIAQGIARDDPMGGQAQKRAATIRRGCCGRAWAGK